jgi:hypothetical protein
MAVTKLYNWSQCKLFWALSKEKVKFALGQKGLHSLLTILVYAPPLGPGKESKLLSLVETSYLFKKFYSTDPEKCGRKSTVPFFKMSKDSSLFYFKILSSMVWTSIVVIYKGAKTFSRKTFGVMALRHYGIMCNDT